MLVRSSLLVAADMLVSGVLIVLPALLPFTEPFGVSVEPDVVASDLPLAACFAAFSARRFCFEAEGAMVVGREDVRARVAPPRALHAHRSGLKFRLS